MDKIVEKTVRDIKSLKIQGARNIALAALDALNHVASKKGFGREFEQAADALEKSRTTAVPLYNVLKIAKTQKDAKTMDELKKFFEISGVRTAQNGASLIKNNMTIITHCHSSEAVLVMKLAKKAGKKFRVIVTETRPKMQGLKTAKELVSAKIPVEYVVDSAAGYYFSAQPDKPEIKDLGGKDAKNKGMKIFLVGCDSIRPEGIYNKIGTYLMAIACYENNIPVYFIGDSFKIDMRKSIEVEMREEKEIIAPRLLKGAKVLNPAFDCTPWLFVSGVVTERGIFRNWRALNK